MGNFSTTEDTKREVLALALTETIQHVAKHPDKAEVSFEVEASLYKGLTSDISIRNFDLIADEPEKLGGTNLGPTPVELVLAGFASCQEIVISAYAAVLDIPVQRVKVRAKGDLDLRGFFNLDEAVRPGFTKVSFETEIYTKETDPYKLKQLEYFATTKCPVLDIIQQPVQVEGAVSFRQAVLN